MYPPNRYPCLRQNSLLRRLSFSSLYPTLLFSLSLLLYFPSTVFTLFDVCARLRAAPAREQKIFEIGPFNERNGTKPRFLWLLAPVRRTSDSPDAVKKAERLFVSHTAGSIIEKDAAHYAVIMENGRNHGEASGSRCH